MKTLGTLITAAALTLTLSTTAQAGGLFKTTPVGGSQFVIQFGTPGVFLHYGNNGRPYGYYKPFKRFYPGVYKPWPRYGWNYGKGYYRGHHHHRGHHHYFGNVKHRHPNKGWRHHRNHPRNNGRGWGRR